MQLVAFFHEEFLEKVKVHYIHLFRKVEVKKSNTRRPSRLFLGRWSSALSQAKVELLTIELCNLSDMSQPCFLK
jgi:hypothetical protein